MYYELMAAANHENGEETGISRERVLEFMEESDWPVTSKYVGSKLETTQQNAYYYLRQLRDDGKVERVKLTNNVVLWRPVTRR